MVYYRKIFLFFIIFTFIFTSSSFALTDVYDIEEEIIFRQEESQRSFTFHCFNAMVSNSSYWNNTLKPILDLINQYSYDYNVGSNKSNNSVNYYVSLFYYNTGSAVHNYSWSSQLTNQTYSIEGQNVPRQLYTITYNPTTYTGSSSVSTSNYTRPVIELKVKSPVFLEFMQVVYNNASYDNILNSMLVYLQNISNLTVDVLYNIQDISSSISQLNIPDYSTQISNISGQISQILTDNSTIISQNTDMLQEQQEINTNLENLNDNLMNDNFDNSNLNLPTNNTQNSADSGINNIFSNMYNAFCTGVAQDIILPIPFTNKNITIEPDFLYNALYYSNANWLILFIQAFWGYLIGRFIVLDVNNKFNKIKSGNIDNLENSNIKGELL